MEARLAGSTTGVYCPTCGWSVVTTRIPEIQLDRTKYAVRISGADFHNPEHVRVVAHVSGLNYLETRNMLQDPQAVVYSGLATDIDRARKALADAGLHCKIEPEFPW